jgi:sodium-dependent dicarboxylate transporter 2/3/5
VTDPTLTDSTVERAGWPRALALIGGPALGAAGWLLLSLPADAPPAEARAALAVLVWMAVWWLSEAAPLAVTSLLPIVLLPLLGISPLREAASPFADRIIFLFLGGFMLALAMERWNLHQRIALATLRLFGASPPRMVGGAMLATGVMSMWVSNTASVLMMLPIMTAIIALYEKQTGRAAGGFGVCCLLGIAYAGSIGGMATPIGSPPNAIAIGFLDRQYGLKVSFFQWMCLAAPVSAVMLVVAWLYLTKIMYRLGREEIPGGRAMIERSLRELGSMSRGEKSVMAVFFATVAAWVLREPLLRLFPGTGAWLGPRIDDTTIAVCAAVVLFVLPVDLRRRVFVLDWRSTARLPWEVLLLFGGGLSLASAVHRLAAGWSRRHADDPGGAGLRGGGLVRLRGDEQHRAGEPLPADPRRGGAGDGDRPGAAGALVRPRAVAGVHDADGDAAERAGLQHGAGDDPADGGGRAWAELHLHRRYCSGLVHHRAARVRERGRRDLVRAATRPLTLKAFHAPPSPRVPAHAEPERRQVHP